MNVFSRFSRLRLSRRSLGLAAALVGTVSLAIGAHAALNKRALDGAKVTAAEQMDSAGSRSSRIALVIGNSHYPDASLPLTQPVNDARALTAALRHEGFDVDVIEDASHDDMTRAVARLKSKVRADSVVMLFFGGYGIQVGRESYMIPVDAVIWKEADVRREGISVEAVLDAAKEFGASAKLVVLDASRRNPYERRFRTFSHGLAPITLPDNALLLTSTSPGTVADDSAGENSALVSELLTHIDSKADQARDAEAIFNQTRVAISRASNGEQVPAVSSTLLEDISFNAAHKPDSKPN
ncbi:MAG TPA: caspase family protein [Bradyrhizobium sp.]|uniref:caspase family protein n=1 Tax=Bradyrhizobium sp. TaxID=376 RepID=UPI002D805E6A|nr:caspase family protein [Bradyrhizobium sp.]HET7886842.1 caspase family protein [Bradyrhizobium sp.]